MKVEGLIRCDWANTLPLQVYHDEEWGDFSLDDNVHFEHICLEGFQSGLSWGIILRKREALRKMFRGFKPEKIVDIPEKEIERIYLDERGIRNRKKIDSVFNNARCFLEIQRKYGSFAEHIFEFIGGKIVVGSYESSRELPPFTESSVRLGKYLKKQGFTYVGPTTIYAHMQAVGFVNDHINFCFKK